MSSILIAFIITVLILPQGMSYLAYPVTMFIAYLVTEYFAGEK